MTRAGAQVMLAVAQRKGVPIARSGALLVGSGARLDMVMVQSKLPHRRHSAVRVGWNAAAWGQPRQDMDVDLASWYERGYTGGLIFRQKRSAEGAILDTRTFEPRDPAAT